MQAAARPTTRRSLRLLIADEVAASTGDWLEDLDGWTTTTAYMYVCMYVCTTASTLQLTLTLMPCDPHTTCDHAVDACIVRAL